MKRLIAVLLALSMAFYVAPLNAIAATNDSFSQTITVNSQPDADLVQAIASDPFLTQANSASQEQNATVDTSNMSMEATNSFGKLLLNGMDEENGSNFSSDNRIISVTLNGKTATVKYLVEEDADLVVGIYADDAEEQMVASGTVAVTKTTDGTTTVAITGDIPEYYVIKGYLFDKAEHAPLCEPYKNISNVEEIVDLESATIYDFDSERTINLDEDSDTNFGVLQKDVTFIRANGVDEENGVGENYIAIEDNDKLFYQIENASEEFLSLKQGDIVVYEYAKQCLLIARITSIDVSGTTVTFYGDNTLSLGDVFETLKLDGDGNSDDAVVDESTGDSQIKYIGKQEIETIESTNGKAEFSHVFKISTDDFKDDKEDKSDWTVGGSVDGTLSITAGIDVAVRITKGEEYFSLSLPLTETYELTGTGEIKGVLFHLPEFTVPVQGLFSVGFAPQIVFKASASLSFSGTIIHSIGIEWGRNIPTQDTSQEYLMSTNFKLEGTVYIGLDLGPEVKFSLANKLDLLSVKLKAEGGIELSATETMGELGVGQDEIHECITCYEGELKFKLTFGISLKMLFYEPGVTLKPIEHSFGKAYASQDHGTFGWGSCPYKKYRLTFKAGTGGAGVKVKIESIDSDKNTLYTEIVLDSDGNGTVYLPEKEYLIIADKGSKEFTKTFTLSRGMTVEVDLGNEPDIPTGGTVIASGDCGAQGDNVKWTLDSNGVLTISGTGDMYDWYILDDTDYYLPPWQEDKNLIEYVLVNNGVTHIGRHAFDYCENLKSAVISDSVKSIGAMAFDSSGLTSIILPSISSIGFYAFYNCMALKDIYFKGTVAQWGLSDVENTYAGNDRLLHCTIHCTDGDIVPTIENSITTGKPIEANAKLHAIFNGLTAGEEYTVIVSESAMNPFDTNNLIYVNQKTADANGILDAQFISDEGSTAVYVVACRKGGSSNTGGNTSKDDTIKPSEPQQDDESDAIVGIVLIGGAAIAAVIAGIILIMPVEVSGVAQLSDGNVLANANVQLMKDGQQVAQTTTDESGHFALEVKRGEYQLNVTTFNPETGEEIVRTTSIKAPAKNTNFVF